MNFLASNGETWNVNGKVDAAGNVEITLNVIAPVASSTTFRGQFNKLGDTALITVARLRGFLYQLAGVINGVPLAPSSFTQGQGPSVVPIAGGLRIQGQGAGEHFDYPWGLWGSYQYSDFEDDFAATAFDANSHTVYLGADFSPWDNWVFGALVSYESVDNDTTFNSGED